MCTNRHNCVHLGGALQCTREYLNQEWEGTGRDQKMDLRPGTNFQFLSPSLSVPGQIGYFASPSFASRDDSDSGAVPVPSGVPQRPVRRPSASRPASLSVPSISIPIPSRPFFISKFGSPSRPFPSRPTAHPCFKQYTKPGMDSGTETWMGWKSDF